MNTQKVEAECTIKDVRRSQVDLKCTRERIKSEKDTCT